MSVYLLFQVVNQPFIDTSGVALSGGRIDTYLAGTSTPVATFSDNVGTSYGTSITLDSTGRTPHGWYGDQTISYKIRVFNVSNVEQTQYQQDNITFPSAETAAPASMLQRGRSTITGTTANYDLDAIATSDQSEISYWEWNGASALTLSGITGGSDGRLLYIQNVTPAQYMWLKSNDSGSTAANRFNTESTNGQYLGPFGTAIAIYDATSLLWFVTVLDPGAPITPTFSAGDYTSWTVASGDVQTCCYQQRGKMLTAWFSINTSTVAGGTALLQRVIPGGFTAAKTCHVGYVQAADNSVAAVATMSVAGGTVIRFSRNDGANWSAATDTTSVSGVATIEVV